MKRLATLILVTSLGLGPAAHAKPLEPSGTYTEAAAKKQEESKDSWASVRGQVKGWLSDKWRTIRGEKQPVAQKTAPVRRPIAAQPPVAPPAASSAPLASNETETPQSPDSTAGETASPAAPAVVKVEKPVEPVSTSTRELRKLRDTVLSMKSTAPVSAGREGSSRLPKQKGVPVYEIGNVEAVPRLDIGEEARISAADFAIEPVVTKYLNLENYKGLKSPPLVEAKKMAALRALKPAKVAKAQKFPKVAFKPKGRLSRARFDRIVAEIKAENKIDLKKYKALTPNEIRMLSGLLLFQQGDKCPVAVGLFHSLSKVKTYQAEADYHMAICSKKMGLTTDFMEQALRVVKSQDPYYTKKLFKELPADIPHEFVEPFGKVLYAASLNKKLMTFEDPVSEGNVYYMLATYGAQTARFKTTLMFSRLIPESHPKYLEAQFLQALAEYQAGSKAQALKIQDELIRRLDSDKAKRDFQAMVALNLARMQFQERQFKASHDNFLKMYKDHPLWLQGLTELGWAQLMSGDFEGAIGNMYSVQSPYFDAVYKPESYVIRTIGYLNLCQYGDAYRTLSTLEHHYRPHLQKVRTYIQQNKQARVYYETVRKFINGNGKDEVDGLPGPVIREMARHKDFLNLQKALNRNVDERANYAKLDDEVTKSVKRSRWLVTNSRNRITEIKNKIRDIKKNPQLEANRSQWRAELDREFELLNNYFFEVDIYNDARKQLEPYKKEVVGLADKRIADMRGKIELTLSGRLHRMKDQLERVLDNNELLRYEVFAGSGENIRYQVAGGEKGNRVPANVRPASKSLQWDFDGEYWEDEIGHYRSSLKNNCASNTAILESPIPNGGAQ